MNTFYYGIFLLMLLSVSVFTIVNSVDDAFAYKSKENDSSQSDHIQTQLNKYSNYVHLQPEWNSYPYNMLFDVSIFWDRDTSVQQEESFGGAKNRVNGLQYLNDKSYVEVQYDYLDCGYQWIHYARYGFDLLNSNFDFWSGKQLSSDYNSALFSNVPGTMSNSNSASSSFVQFIPICTSQILTSFDYGVRIDDKDMQFDVYFVPSIQERLDYFVDGEFEHYLDDGCSGLGYVSFGGTCNDVGPDSGLLIVIPDALEKPLTKISIKLKEVEMPDDDS